MHHLISSMSDAALKTEIFFNGTSYDFRATLLGDKGEVIAKIENITLSEAIKQTTLSWVAEVECWDNPYAEAQKLLVPML